MKTDRNGKGKKDEKSDLKRLLLGGFPSTMTMPVKVGQLTVPSISSEILRESRPWTRHSVKLEKNNRSNKKTR